MVNDIQMILHASPVNRAREDRGEPAINSVWPWGGGYTPRVPPSQWRAVWSDEPLIEGLALLAGSASQTLPGDARGWLARVDSPGQHLLVLSAGHVAARSGDVEAWRRFIAELDEAWMAPLLDALAGRRLQSVVLRTGEGIELRLGRRRLGRWWRRDVPFARIVARAAQLR